MSTEILEHPNKQCKGHRACSQPVSRNIVHNMPCQIPLLTVWPRFGLRLAMSKCAYLEPKPILSMNPSFVLCVTFPKSLLVED